MNFKLCSRYHFKKNQRDIILLLLLLFFITQHQVAWDPFKSPEIIKDLKQQLEKTGQEGKSEILNQISHAYLQKSLNPEVIIEYGELALKYAKKFNQTHQEILALANIGHGYRRIMKFDKALAYINQAIELAKTKKDYSGENYALEILSDFYFENNKMAQSLKIRKKLLEISLRENNKKNMAKFYILVGKCLISMTENYQNQSQYRKYLKNALLISREINDKENEVITLHYIGNFEVTMNNIDEAINTYLKALAICQKENLPQYIPQITSSIGDVFIKLENYKKAFENYLDALKYYQNTESDYDLYMLYRKMGLACSGFGDNNKAIKYLLMSKKIGDKIYRTPNREVANTLISLASIYLNMEKYDSALLNFKKAVSILQENKLIYMIPIIYHRMGLIYEEIHNYVEAEKYFLEGLRIAKELDLKEFINENYNGLAEIYEKLKNFEKAFYYLKKSISLKDEISKQKQEESAKEILVKYETEKKEKEIELLKKNDEIKNLRLDRANLLRNAFVAGFFLVLIILVLLFNKYMYLFAFWKKHSYIGQYRILGKIGSGGMGTIYKAKNITDKTQTVAIKVLNEELLKDETQRKRFNRESLIIDQLEHPNIIKILERGEDKKTSFIVMEFLTGKTLSQILRDNERLPLKDSLPIMIQISDALVQIHGKNIIHRDLNPNNIMLIEKNLNPNFVKLLDFGLAKNGLETTITQAGYALGTIRYMSPEQLIGKKDITIKSDIFSLGIIFYEMVTGIQAFSLEIGEVANDILNKVLTEPVDIQPDVPVALNHLIMYMIEKDPQKRPVIEDVLKTLKEIS